MVDFAGFEDMVDAIDGVPVCIPEDIDDPAHGINIPAGTREVEGREALNYVRARYTLGDGSDIGRIKRQQAFIAAMAEKVISGGTLARLDRLVGFLDAATKSLTVDKGLDNDRQDRPDRASASRTSAWTTSSSSPCPGSTTSGPSTPAGSPGSRSSNELWDKIAADEPLDPSGSPTRRSAPPSRSGSGSGNGNPSGNAEPERGRRGRGERPVRMTTPDRDPETPAERRRRLAAVFGDVLPETTSDERDPGDAGATSDDPARRVAARAGAAAPRLLRRELVPAERRGLQRVRRRPAGRGSPAAARCRRACPAPRSGSTSPSPWCRAPRRRSRRPPRG